MTTGERIQKYRKEKGLTQKELGEKVGLKEITIRQYETNKRQPRMLILRDISKVLGVYIGDLIEDWYEYVDDDLFTSVAREDAVNRANLPKKDEFDISDDLKKVFNRLQNGERGLAVYEGVKIPVATQKLFAEQLRTMMNYLDELIKEKEGNSSDND